MLENVRAAIMGSFVGDSMALGTHWVYDQDAIKRRHGRVDSLLKPDMVQYHQNRELGDFTHYGDQAYELLMEVSREDSFDLGSFSSRFRSLFKGDYKGYIDHATQQTLDLIGECTSYEECTSHSTDLGGASRIAPLFLAYGDDINGLLDATQWFVSYTHDEIRVKEAAAFFAEVTYKIIHEEISPVVAIGELLESKKYIHIESMIKEGLRSADKESVHAIAFLGMSCSVDGALASTIHLIAKYENDFKEAMINNVMAGGDSAARGMLVGMVLGAYLGMDAIPTEWLNALKRRDDIDALINHTKHFHYYDVA